jgi:enamine deaminase RidA (YjgF/YER057c/UK114 family)
MAIQRINPARLYSDATVHQSTAYFVEVPSSRHTDIRTQALELFAAADATLSKVGSSRAHLLSATIYLPEMRDREAFNEEWERWLPPGCAPSRACVRAGLADDGLKVEVAFVAAVTQPGRENRESIG